jgi:hypothetical protein
MDDSSGFAALAILVSGTSACLSFAMVWAIGTRRPSRRRPHLTGRAAAPYWHSPTGLQDERGIVPMPDR